MLKVSETETRSTKKWNDNGTKEQKKTEVDTTE